MRSSRSPAGIEDSTGSAGLSGVVASPHSASSPAGIDETVETAVPAPFPSWFPWFPRFPRFPDSSPLSFPRGEEAGSGWREKSGTPSESRAESKAQSAAGEAAASTRDRRNRRNTARHTAAPRGFPTLRLSKAKRPHWRQRSKPRRIAAIPAEKSAPSRNRRASRDSASRPAVSTASTENRPDFERYA